MKELRELQAILIKIDLGEPVFFNIVQFKDVQGLVKKALKNLTGLHVGF